MIWGRASFARPSPSRGARDPLRVPSKIEPHRRCRDTQGQVPMAWRENTGLVVVAASLMLAVSHGAAAPAAPTASAAAADAVAVKVSNPLRAARGPETVAVAISELRALAPALDPVRAVVTD